MAWSQWHFPSLIATITCLNKPPISLTSLAINWKGFADEEVTREQKQELYSNNHMHSLSFNSLFINLECIVQVVIGCDYRFETTCQLYQAFLRVSTCDLKLRVDVL